MNRIVFMGTPEFAVPSLEALAGAKYDIVGVFTQPDRPAGRGNKLTACPVKQAAQKLGLPVFQFERLRRKEGVEALRSLRPDLVVTAAFGQILSQKLLDVPRLGTVNVHASLLPQYRGAAPINWCILEGERVAGVTTMMTDAGIDTGDILMSRSLDIGALETAGELTERLSHLGAELLLETLAAMEAGTCPRAPQDESRMSHQPMLDKSMGEIRWQNSAERIVNQIRGLNPWPVCWTRLHEGVLKLYLAAPAQGREGALAGEVLCANSKQGLIVACADGGAVEVLQMQAPGGKRMEAKAYLAGKNIPVGTVLGGEEDARV